MRLTSFLVVLALVGCQSPPVDQPQTPRIAVVEFAIAPNLVVRRMDGGPRHDSGMLIAKELAADLQRRRHQAAPFDADTPPVGDVIVTGRILRMDNGSKGLRSLRIAMLVTFWPVGLAMLGAGNGEVAVEGDIHRTDGTHLGSYSFEVPGGSLNEEGGMTAAARRLAARMGPMLVSGHYPAPRPHSEPTPTSTPPPTSRATTSDRLSELDALRGKGLISEDEYQRKRAQILGDF